MNARYLIEALAVQRDDALNRLAEAVAKLRERDEEIARLEAAAKRRARRARRGAAEGGR